MKNFKDKVAVITGAASGMGRAYAIEFAKLGAKLSLCDIDIKSLQKVQLELLEFTTKNKIYIEKIDVSNKDAVFSFAENSKATFGNAHVVINNAGIEGVIKPFYLIEINEFKRLMDINFYGVVYGTKAFLPQLVENNEGVLVNVASTFGLIGAPVNSDYCASKFAITGFTESLAVEFYKSPITIHCVHPGGINTNIAKNAESKKFAKKYLTTPPSKIAKYVIKSIKSKKTKIVYGKDSSKIRFASNFLPKSIYIAYAWREFKKTMNFESFKTFIPDILRKN